MPSQSFLSDLMITQIPISSILISIKIGQKTYSTTNFFGVTFYMCMFQCCPNLLVSIFFKRIEVHLKGWFSIGWNVAYFRQLSKRVDYLASFCFYFGLSIFKSSIHYYFLVFRKSTLSEPEKRTGSWGMIVSLDRSLAKPIRPMFWPSIVIWPPAASISRNKPKAVVL